MDLVILHRKPSDGYCGVCNVRDQYPFFANLLTFMAFDLSQAGSGCQVGITYYCTV